MTAKVYVVGPEAPVVGIHNLMNAKRIRHVPVVDDDGVLVGLVTQQDVLRCTFPPDGNLLPSTRISPMTSVRAGDIMTEEIETVQVDEDLTVAARLMFEGKYACLPVIEDGLLTGIITERDFVRLVAGVADEGDVDDEDDDDDEADEDGAGVGEDDDDEDDEDDEDEDDTEDEGA